MVDGRIYKGEPGRTVVSAASEDRITKVVSELTPSKTYRDELVKALGEEAADARMALTEARQRNLWSHHLGQRSWFMAELLEKEHNAHPLMAAIQAASVLEDLADLDRQHPSARFLFAVAGAVLGGEAQLEEIAELATAIKTRVRAALEARDLIKRVTHYEYAKPVDRDAHGGVVPPPLPADLSLSDDWRPVKTEESIRFDAIAYAPGIPARTVETPKGPILALDAFAADLLEELGEKNTADRIRESKLGDTLPTLWRRWIPYRVVPELHGGPEKVAAMGLDADMAPAVLAIARAVLAQLRAERERARASRPAVVRATMAGVLLPVMSRQTTLPTLDDGRVLDAKRREIGRIALVSARMTNEGVRRGLELFGTVPGNRLLKSLVLRSHEQQERGDPFALRVRYAGGWAGLAESLRFKDKNTAPLERMAEAGAAVVWSTPYAKGMALWALAVTRGNHLRPGEVAFTLNTPLAPGYAAELAHEKHNSLVARTARRLVPELRYEPPTGAVRPNEAGAVWTLHRRFLLELVDRATELVVHGGIALSLDDWRRFAAEVGLPLATLPRVLDAWRVGESGAAPALLSELEPGRFTLADAHDLERRFLLEAGERRLKGRDAGRKGKRAKRSEER